MKLSEMVPGVRYIVTKGSRGNFEVGQQLEVVGNDAICVCGASWDGRMDAVFWKRLKAEVEVDTVWHMNQALNLRELALHHENIVNGVFK
jgi:hypothetical protein